MTGNNQKDQNMTKKSVALVASQYRVPFVLLTSLFFLIYALHRASRWFSESLRRSLYANYIRFNESYQARACK